MRRYYLCQACLCKRIGFDECPPIELYAILILDSNQRCKYCEGVSIPPIPACEVGL